MLNVYLSTRQRDGSNFGYLSAKILIIGSNKRVKIYHFELKYVNVLLHI